MPVSLRRAGSLFGADAQRSGFLTSAAESGASIWKLMETSRHRSVDTLRGYVRRVDLFRAKGSIQLGLPTVCAGGRNAASIIS
jgi:hypothetical protein